MTRVSLLLSLAVVAVLAAPTAAQDATTITGELVDVTCHKKMGEKATGASHANCATSCAKRGQPLGIATADGVYTITGPLTENMNEKLVEYVAKTVTVTGTVSERDGAKTIAATDIAPAK